MRRWLVGGAVIQRTGDVVLTYAGIGALVFALPVGFSFSSAWKTLPEEARS